MVSKVGEMNEVKEVSKSVKIGNTVYQVKISEKEVSAKEIVYPNPPYGNNWGNEYVVDLSYRSKRWVKLYIYSWNYGWACRGHGMTDSWVSSVGYVKREEATRFVEKIREELEKAENDTPDVKQVFSMIYSYVRDKVGGEG